MGLIGTVRGGGEIGVCIQLLQFRLWKESELGLMLNSKGVHKVLGHIPYLCFDVQYC